MPRNAPKGPRESSVGGAKKTKKHAGGLMNWNGLGLGALKNRPRRWKHFRLRGFSKRTVTRLWGFPHWSRKSLSKIAATNHNNKSRFPLEFHWTSSGKSTCFSSQSCQVSFSALVREPCSSGPTTEVCVYISWLTLDGEQKNKF